MNQDNSAYRDQLEADLLHVFNEGLPDDIEPVTVPALAEMAEARADSAYDDEPDYYSWHIEELLRAAIEDCEETNKRRQGLEKLFGLTQPKLLGLGERREEAAPLLGYGGKETLRKSSAENEIRSALLAAILALGEVQGFVYSGRYMPRPANAPAEAGIAASVAEADTYPPAEPTLDDVPQAQPAAAVSEAQGESPTRPEPLAEPDESSPEKRWSLRTRPVVGLVLAVLAAAVAALVVALASSGSAPKYPELWGPTRPLYDYAKYDGNNNCADPTNPATEYGRCGAIADNPVFNSFFNTPYYGDERFFFDGYRAERANGHAEDPIRNVTAGDKIVVLRVYVDNMAQVDRAEPTLTTAYNARVRVELPTTTGTALVAYAYISANRARTVFDSVRLIASKPFQVEYIPGSAVLYDRVNGHNESHTLSDEIIGSEGALIGVSSMNGVLPPSDAVSGATVEVEVRAVSSP